MKEKAKKKNNTNPHLRVITNNENMPDENIADVHGTQGTDADMDGSRSKIERMEAMTGDTDAHAEQNPVEGSAEDIEKAIGRGDKSQAA